MMRSPVRIGIVLGALLLSPISKADHIPSGPRWELWSGPLVDFTQDLNSNTFSGSFLGGRTSILPSIGYVFSEHFEALFAPSFHMHSSGNYVGRVTFGVCGNFQGKSLGDSAFGKVMFGFDDILDNKTSDNINFTLRNLMLSISVGKRIVIYPYFSFTPEVNLTLLKESYSVISSLSFIPLQFGLYF